ncbi:hypothetical protein Vretifemale_1404 [Volvox reticuliferus]|nr:hypothetical protein Vretifemale_1404 [Volvox reticuliferus]
MTSGGGSSVEPDAPEPPLPYPGDDRLVSCMRRALKGLMSFVQRSSLSQAGASAAAGDRGMEVPGLVLGIRQPLPHAATWQPQPQPQQQQQMTELPGCDVAGPDAQQTCCASSCLATLGSWSEVVQVVDLSWELQRRGLTAAQAAHLLDAGLSLRLSVHVGARADTAAEYGVALMLDEGDCHSSSGGGGAAAAPDAIPSLQSFVSRPSRHLGYREREFVPPDTWERFEYVLAALPRGARRAIVMLRGRRSPTFSAGSNHGPGGRDAHRPSTRFCGAKFASAQLVFA